MAKKELQNKWLALRATGLSYRKISDRIGVSPQTQVKWEKILKDELQLLKSKDSEFINEQLNLTKTHRLESLSNQLEKIEEELEKRGISDIPTASLMKIFESFIKTIQKETEVNMPANAAIDGSMKRYIEILNEMATAKEEDEDDDGDNDDDDDEY